jgi:hypothetical protein
MKFAKAFRLNHWLGMTMFVGIALARKWPVTAAVMLYQKTHKTADRVLMVWNNFRGSGCTRSTFGFLGDLFSRCFSAAGAARNGRRAICAGIVSGRQLCRERAWPK